MIPVDLAQPHGNGFISGALPGKHPAAQGTVGIGLLGTGHPLPSRHCGLDTVDIGLGDLSSTVHRCCSSPLPHHG